MTHKNEDSTEPKADEVTSPNGVLVLRVVEDDGRISTTTQPLGDVKVTEIQTILELGIQDFRAKAGLNR